MDGTEPVLAASGAVEVAATKDEEKAEVEADAAEQSSGLASIGRAISIAPTRLPLHISLTGESSFLRELADLASDDLRRLCRYTIKNHIRRAAAFSDVEDGIGRSVEATLNNFFGKLGDYVDFAVRHVDRVIKDGGAGCADSNDLTCEILQCQLRRSIEHGRELGDSLEQMMEKDKQMQSKIWDMRRMYFLEIQNLRQRIRYMQQTALMANVRLDDALLEGLGESNLDEEVVFWDDSRLTEPWMKDLLKTQANDLKSRYEDKAKMQELVIDNLKARIDEADTARQLAEDQLVGMRAKYKLGVRQSLAQAAVSPAHQGSPSHPDVIDEEDEFEHRREERRKSASGSLSPSKYQIGRSRRRSTVVAEHQEEEFFGEVELTPERMQAMQATIDDGVVKLNALRELHDNWSRKLEETDDTGAKETSKSMVSQIRERVDKIHTEFHSISRMSGFTQTGGEKDPWLACAELTEVAEKLKNENAMLVVDKQHLQSLLHKEKEEPLRLRKQLRQYHTQVESLEQDKRKDDHTVELLKTEKAQLEDQVKKVLDMLKTTSQKVEDEKKKTAQAVADAAVVLKKGANKNKEKSRNNAKATATLVSEIEKEPLPPKSQTLTDLTTRVEEKLEEARLEGGDEHRLDEPVDGTTEEAKEAKVDCQISDSSEFRSEVQLEASGLSSQPIRKISDDSQESSPKASRRQRPAVVENSPSSSRDTPHDVPFAAPEVPTNFQAGRRKKMAKSIRKQSTEEMPTISTPEPIAYSSADSNLDSITAQARQILAKRKSREDLATIDFGDDCMTPKAPAPAPLGEQLGAEKCPPTPGQIGREGGMLTQKTMSKAVHTRLLNVAVDRERRKWQAFLPRTYSMGAFPGYRANSRQEIPDKPELASQRLESLLSAAEEEVHFQRCSALFENLSGGRLLKSTQAEEPNKTYLRVLATTEKLRKMLPQIVDRQGAAMYSADQSRLEADNLRARCRELEVQGRVAWELQRQGLQKCQKMLTRAGGSSHGLKIDSALLNTTPKEALHLLSEDLERGEANSTHRQLVEVCTKAERLAKAAVEEISRCAMEDARLLAPEHERLAQQVFERHLASEFKDGITEDDLRAVVEERVGEENSPNSRTSDKTLSRKLFGDISKATIEEMDNIVKVDEASTSLTPLAERNGPTEKLADDESENTVLSADDESLSFEHVVCSRLEKLSKKQMESFLAQKQASGDAKAALRVVRRLELASITEAETSASDGCGGHSDDEVSLDDYAGISTRRLVEYEIDDAEDIQFGENRALPIFAPMALPANDEPSKNDISACEVRDYVCSWRPLPQLELVKEVDNVTRQRSEALERSADARFRRLKAHRTEIEQDIAAEARPRKEHSSDFNLRMLTWTPPRTPPPEKTRRGARDFGLTTAETDNETNLETEQPNGRTAQKAEEECTAVLTVLSKAFEKSFQMDERPRFSVIAPSSPSPVAIRGSVSNSPSPVAIRGSVLNLPVLELSDEASQGGEQASSPPQSRSPPQSPILRSRSRKSTRKSNLLGLSPTKAGGKRLSGRGSRLGSRSVSRAPSPGGEPNATQETGGDDPLTEGSQLLVPQNLVEWPSESPIDQGDEIRFAAPEHQKTAKEISETLMRGVLNIVNGAKAVGLESIADLVGPETKVEICKGFLEAFREQEAVVNSMAEQHTSKAQDQMSPRRTRRISKPMLISKVPMIDAETQVNRDFEEKVVRKNQNTQTDVQLNERDESTRRLNFRGGVALESLAAKLGDGGDLLDMLASQIDDGLDENPSEQDGEREGDATETEISKPVEQLQSLVKSFQTEGNEASTSERAAVAGLAATMLLMSSRAQSRANSAPGSRRPSQPPTRSSSRRPTAAPKESALALNADIKSEASSADPPKPADTPKPVEIIMPSPPAASSMDQPSQDPTPQSVEAEPEDQTSSPQRRKALTSGKVTRMTLVQEPQRQESARTEDASDDDRVSDKQSPPKKPSPSPKPNDASNDTSRNGSEHHSPDLDKEVDVNLKIEDFETDRKSESSEGGKSARSSRSFCARSMKSRTSARSMVSEAGLLDLLSNIVNEVVDFSQNTELAWDKIPARILTWLKHSLMQKQQARLYCTTWQSAEMEDFPNISLLERERIIRDFESFLFQIMALVAPTRGTEQRRALRKQFRDTCLGTLTETLQELDTSTSVPRLTYLEEQPSLVIQSLNLSDVSVANAVALRARSVGGFTGGPTIGLVPKAVKRQASEKLLHSDPTASTLSIDSTLTATGQILYADASTLSIDSVQVGLLGASSTASINEGVVIDGVSVSEGFSLCDEVHLQCCEPPEGLSHHERVAYKLGSLLGFDVSWANLEQVQQDVYCIDYFKSQEKMASQYRRKIQEFSVKQNLRNNQSILEPAASTEPGSSADSDVGTDRKLNSEDASDIMSLPPPSAELYTDPVANSAYDDDSEPEPEEPAPEEAQRTDSHRKGISLVDASENAEDSLPRRPSAAGSGPVAASMLSHTPLKRAGLQPWAKHFKRASISLSESIFETDAKRARLFAQHMDAIRPYHIFGPIPEVVVKKIKRLSDTEAKIEAHMDVLKGDVQWQAGQNELVESLEPLLVHISSALVKSNKPLGAQEEPSVVQEAHIDESALWMDEVASRIAGRQSADVPSIRSALEGLCNGAMQRDKVRKGLLQYGFQMLRPRDQAPANGGQLQLVIDSKLAPPASAPAKLGLRNLVQDGAYPTEKTLRAYAREDIVASQSMEHRRPWTSGFGTSLKRPLEPTQTSEFIGAVAWNYASPSSHSVGRATTAANSQRFRPGTAPIAHADAASEGSLAPHPTTPSQAVPPSRERCSLQSNFSTFSMESNFPPNMILNTPHGSQTPMVFSAPSVGIVENLVSSSTPRATSSSIPVRPIRPRRNFSSAIQKASASEPSATESPSPWSPEVCNSNSSADHHPATDTPAISVFAQALVRAPNRGKLGGAGGRKAPARG